TCPADPARTRRDKKSDDGPDLFGPSEAAKRQVSRDELGNPGRILQLPAMPRTPRKHNRSRRPAVAPNVFLAQTPRPPFRPPPPAGDATTPPETQSTQAPRC